MKLNSIGGYKNGLEDKKFDELTVKELYEILKVRAEVFVVEQECVYQDLDSKDENAYHLFGEDQGEVVGYLRILPKGIAYEEAKESEEC